jgi:hypothetical protein
MVHSVFNGIGNRSSLGGLGAEGWAAKLWFPTDAIPYVVVLACREIRGIPTPPRPAGRPANQPATHACQRSLQRGLTPKAGILRFSAMRNESFPAPSKARSEDLALHARERILLF